MQVKCNNCDWVGDEEDLSLLSIDVNEEVKVSENKYGVVYDHNAALLHCEFIKGCPNCLTDNYLMDL